MAAPYPDQQAFPTPHPYQKYPEDGYQPAPAQFPSQQAAPLPPQNQPPPYAYGGQQPQQGYQPMPAPAPVTSSNTTVVVASQPAPVTAVYRSPPEEDHSGMAVCAIVFSIITLLCCGTSLVFLMCSIPALILAIVALGTRGSAQKSNAGISIALNVVVVVCTVLSLVIIIPVYFVAFRTAVTSATTGTPTTPDTRTTCPSYYNEHYDNYCVAYSYYTYSYCSYYSSGYSTGYCS